MKKITVLLPIYKLDDDDKIMLANALESVEDFHNDVKLTIICPSNIKKLFDTFDFGQKLEIKILENKSNDTGFVYQINLGIDDCDTEWFSILEIDDEYSKIWLSIMNEWMTSSYDKKENIGTIDVYLPVVKDINVEGKFLSYTNESAWAFGFTKHQGIIDNEVLLEFQNYQTSGGLYRTKMIIDNGKFKENIKLTFSYEFLLRLSNNGVKILTLPRIGYVHTNFRENSLFWNYKHDEKTKLSEKEVKFWIDTARKEYFYKNKRDITYVE